ncbi:MAG: 30S ribosomal protein S4e [Candidatus Altiarchaeota archaeon]
MAHSKRISTGYGKKDKWIVTPKAGAHKKNQALPLMLVLRDVLGLADTAREAKKIINAGDVLVDGVPRRTHNFCVGLMDVVSIPKLKKSYRVLPGRKTPELCEVDEKEAKTKLHKVVGKKTLSGGKTQLQLHDGKTLISDKDKVSVGDTVVMELGKDKILKMIAFKNGNTAIVDSGVNSGEAGKITEINPATRTRKALTKIGDLQTLSDYVFVVGEAEPVITLKK